MTVLICSLLLAQPDCDEHSARAVIRLDASLTCALLAEEQIAATALIGDGEYMKVRCRR